MEPQVHAPPPAGSAPLAYYKVLHMVGDVWVLSVGHVVACGEEVGGEVVDVGGGGGVLNVHVLIGEGGHVGTALYGLFSYSECVSLLHLFPLLQYAIAYLRTRSYSTQLRTQRCQILY
jgi:hypothetical protein